MSCYDLVKQFKKKYPGTVAWRIKKHCKTADKYLNSDETPIFAFAAQRNETPLDIFSTAVFVLTNKRICIAQNRILLGHSFITITPDMFNDLSIYSSIIWGKITIDSVKEVVVFTNISKGALDEIETAVSQMMMHEKKKYKERPPVENVNL